MTVTIQIRRRCRLPDPVAVERCQRTPELGPRILFFSGGTALKKLSRTLKRYTHNSIHLMTPFDSGGSSAALRKAFGMLSIGDLRNRLVALADETVQGNPEIYRLFSHRLRKDGDPIDLGRRLEKMITGEDQLVADVPAPMRQIVQTHLRLFAEKMPPGFDLRGASIGNLMLAGGYLNNAQDIDSVSFLFSKLLNVRGIVRATCDADLHLAAELEDGTRVVGQHLMTGKEVQPLQAPIARFSLVDCLDDPSPAAVSAAEEVQRLVRSSDLIVYPMGSYYSSIMANLLPGGVGRSVVSTAVPKLFIANSTPDPEMKGLSVGESVRRLVELVANDVEGPVEARDVVQFVLLDTANGEYPALELEKLTSLGIEVLDLPLTTERSGNRLDAVKLTEVLLSMAA